MQEPQDYAHFADYDKDPMRRQFNLWTYIDARDAAQAIRLSLEAEAEGRPCLRHRQQQFGDRTSTTTSCSTRSSRGTKRKRAIKPNESLISIEKAQRVLGYKPQYDWKG